MRFLHAVFVFFFITPATALETGDSQPPLSPADAIGLSVQNELAARAKEHPAQKLLFESMLAFYRERGGSPIWIDGDRFNKKAREARRVMARAAEFGLNPADYNPPADSALDQDGELQPETVAEAEISMSLAVVTYARHAQSGRFRPQDLGESFDPSPQLPQAQSILANIPAAASDVGDYLEGFNPQHPQFKALKDQLTKILVQEREAKAPVIPSSGPVLRPGTAHPDVALIRARLKTEAPDGIPEDYYDVTLAEAVKAFQKQNGLPANGILTKGTRRALQARRTVDRKLLIINMERWRWLPRRLGETYVQINLPEFMVRLIRDDQIVFEDRIVIGRPDHQTPILSQNMSEIVFNPYWNVPGSIASKEIIPIMRRNPGYLYRNGLEVFIQGHRWPIAPESVDWDAINPKRLFIRQPPGNGNALGNLKFLFPNKHDVYLHDTPQKYLFNEAVRAYSHGCMRVRNPRKLAEAILGWSKAKVDRTIASGVENKAQPVDPPIPVHVMYFTAWVNGSGNLQIFRDVYGHDAKVAERLKL